ncbi:gliding motility lipoprotein GldH [Pedobacter frigoris]|uniref:gliding motility lipoprotein GldH n=1 Tax=Pedobacter frigoris TaxID=2571272 RepID=UPI00292D08E1|nr:gliding motility lipoprotein GldH [Pedobacter frigoris]
MTRYNFLLFFSAVLTFVISGCDANNYVDTNMSLSARNWSYENKVKAIVDVKDSSKPLNIYFKLRHTADYRYSNIFILLHIKGGASAKQTKRYEYRLAQPDGQWNGSGSGNLFTYTLPLLTNYKFAAPGKYELEIEQNMRDNPLKEISDVGIKVSEQGK